ncbi:uncharacterized protein [Clytia hemisphaerica]|uniref:uncharacterized protein n=1 Tax=Clytia hemisphaerica TaxID=252671 RepID=UPI0034D68AA4
MRYLEIGKEFGDGTTEVEQCKPQKEFEENILRADLHKHSVNVPSQVDNVQSQQLEEAEPKIELGMMVEFMIKEKLYYGCVKWLGTLDIKGKMIELLGLEMETYEIANNSGFFLGQKYFDCPEGKGFFAKTKICRVDRRSGDATSKQDNFNVDRVTSSNKNINPSPSRGIPAIYLENTTELEVRQPALPDLASLPDLPQVTMKKPQPKPRTMIKADAKIEEPVKPSSVSHKDDIVGEQTEMKNEVFKNVEDQCSCAICLEFADEAVECSNCHQVFCQKCIVGLEGCPSCRQTPFRTQPNVILRRIFGSMTTNCTNEGCKERPTRSNLTSHLEKCEWSTIECPNDGCDQKYQKFGSEQHKRQCVYRSEACIGCGHQYKMLDLANHQDQCLFVDVPCMNSNCNEHFLRKDESSHISVCKQQMIRCSFCFFSDTRIQVLHHTIDIHYQEAVGPMSSLAPRSFGASSHQL